MKYLSYLLRIAVAIVLVSLLAPHLKDGVAAAVRSIGHQLAPAVSQGDRNGLNP